MKIALAFNLRHLKPSLINKEAQEEAEFDSPETIEGIKEALEKMGHEVSLVESNSGAFEKFKNLKGKIDLVFNYSEGIAGQDREAQIPTILEILQIPYTGSGPLTSAILLNKARTKEILRFYHLPTANWLLLHSLDDLKSLTGELRFPLIVKPNLEGSSKGIFNDCVVKSSADLRKIVTRTLKNFPPGVLVEEFLPGKEFTAALLADGAAWRVLPLIEVGFSELPPGLNPIDSYEAKWIYDSPEKGIDPLTCPARISDDLRLRIEEICTQACVALEIRDWCRLDLRLDNGGEPQIIEINSPPGIIPDPKENSRYPRAARVAGWEFPQMLQKIIDAAVQRHHLFSKL